MTNGGDKHHGPADKKKAAKAKVKDPKAALKRKNMLPKALATATVQERHGQ